MKILVYPQTFKKQDSRLRFYLEAAGAEFIYDRKDDYDLVLYWNNKLVNKPPKKLHDIAKEKKVLNLHCNNVTKVKVDEVQKKVFGYCLTVDPLTYEGKGVVRNNKQAQGLRNKIRVLDFPVKGIRLQSEGKYSPDYKLYQKFVDTYNEKGNRVEIRVVIVGESIPLIFYKEFTNKNKPFKHYHTQDSFTGMLAYNVFTEKEIKKILQYSKEIGMDFGELDILKDGDKIYVTDVNNIPGPGLFIKRIKTNYDVPVIDVIAEEIKKQFG